MRKYFCRGEFFVYITNEAKAIRKTPDDIEAKIKKKTKEGRMWIKVKIYIGKASSVERKVIKRELAKTVEDLLVWS